MHQGLDRDLVNQANLQPLMHLFDNRHLLAYTFPRLTCLGMALHWSGYELAE